MTPSPGPWSSGDHPGVRRLELEKVELVGGGREIGFHSGLNIIQGDISTGKTTLIGLIRALLGTVPRGFPPEVDYVQAVRAEVVLGDRSWSIYRPKTTTRDALVELGENDVPPGRPPVALRLKAASAEQSYSTFILDRLGIPSISVPQARSEPGGAQTPVTMTDWLGYCIITGDEIDTQVFGHQRVFRDAKRRWVFEIAYGYYDPEMASLNAKLRTIDLQLETLGREAEFHRRFIASTPISDRKTVDARIARLTEQLTHLRGEQRLISSEVAEVPGVANLRESLLSVRALRGEAASRLSRLEGQITDLTDLHRQLNSQSAKLTRAIVADEWLVDFDFVVCPRCGTDVQPMRTPAHLCYLCHQEPQPATSRDQLLIEQERVSNQIIETSEILDLRKSALAKLETQIARLDHEASDTARTLDELTSTFVSDHAAAIAHFASEIARTEGELRRLADFALILDRLDQQAGSRSELEAAREEIVNLIGSWELSRADAEQNVIALEERMLAYLRQLRIPDLGQELTVKINRNTYLPIVAGRSFDELSSQGLKTLVNIAHALAHHTVAIDRGLPMPGLLILDGLSANAGFEGFDQERVNDVYRLLKETASGYEGQLQIVAVDNVLSPKILLQLAHDVVLNLTQEDRLIRLPQDLGRS
ncbi:hypothetical protein [Catellatospora chokoriensis]|uniref:AAA domain-containing protein n=1 Tax=Catellatospora chokoriensis TaxID=310353 RepID=A0A8J3KA65_9ACTN|nr:hypothetical protein [Catellatospora chokoriensis]GIF91389.1 hypothetical protein Cch02nite_48330 [Catellatospora chokoriensis]